MCRETVFEQLEVGYRKRMAALRRTRSDHRKWRLWEREWKHAVEARLKEMEVDRWVHDTESDNFPTKNVDYPSKGRTPAALIGRILRGFKPNKHHNLAFRHCGQVRVVAYGHPGTHLNMEALSPAQLEDAAVEAGIPLDIFFQLRHNHNFRVSKVEEPSENTTAAALHFLREFGTIPLENEHMTPVPDEMVKMSGMLTKFALASTGIAIGANRAPHAPRSGRFGQIQPPEFQRPAVTPTESAHGRDELPTPMRSSNVPNFKKEVQSEEAKAFWAKVSRVPTALSPSDLQIS
jgi:potassium channel subfamily K